MIGNTKKDTTIKIGILGLIWIFYSANVSASFGGNIYFITHLCILWKHRPLIVFSRHFSLQDMGELNVSYSF